MSADVPVSDHLADILGRVRTLPARPHRLLDAVGRPSAQDVVAGISLPVFDNSAMDGYAVRAADVAEVPVELPVSGEIHAGPADVRRIEPGVTARIMTGAAVPEGADAVVPFEWTDGGAERVRITRAPRPGQHVRPAGEDVRAGDRVLTAGEVVGPRQVALLASVGLAELEVPPRPRVVVLSTGAELVEPGEELGRDSIYDSNSLMLVAAARRLGCAAERVRATSDDPEAFLEVLYDALPDADAVITSGGVSMGTRDVVKEALRDRGVRFRPVRMQPGKPQGFGFVEDTAVFTLPGNPVSSYVSFCVFVEPALRQMMGRDPHRPVVRAPLAQPVDSLPGRQQYLRGHFDGERVTPVGGPGSHLLAALSASDALLVVPEEATRLEAGDVVELLLPDREY